MRAKFKVHSVETTYGEHQLVNDANPLNSIPDISTKATKYEMVKMSAVYSEDKNTEDNQFSEATPNGELTMTISNPNAFGFLQEGKSYYLDFTEAK